MLLKINYSPHFAFTLRKFTEAQMNEEQSTQQTVWLLQEVPH